MTAKLRAVVIIFLLSFASGCATTGEPAARYQNFLVLGMTESYNNRAQFERKLASELRERGVSATPYHQAIGGNLPVDRDAVRQLVSAERYDAVIVTRVVDQSVSVSTEQGSVAARTTRRSGRPLDLFRYDYEELNEPASLDFDYDVLVAAELYDAGTEESVWTVEVEAGNEEHVASVIDDVAVNIARRMDRARLLQN